MFLDLQRPKVKQNNMSFNLISDPPIEVVFYLPI